MAISPPKWAKNAMATPRGWVVGNELVKAQKLTQAQVDQYNGVKPEPMEPAPTVVVIESTVDLTTMTKAQLVQYAADNNIEVDERSTKSVILETIQSTG